MKFILTVRHLSGGDPWEEPYDKPELRTQEAVEKWALYIVDWFNGTRRRGERARQLVSVKILSESCEKCHQIGSWPARARKAVSPMLNCVICPSREELELCDRKAIWFRQPRQNR